MVNNKLQYVIRTMALSWNEIKDRALRFSKEWENTTNKKQMPSPSYMPFLMSLVLAEKRLELLNIE